MFRIACGIIILLNLIPLLIKDLIEDYSSGNIPWFIWGVAAFLVLIIGFIHYWPWKKLDN